jgi:uncharacterized glyoxalase superfamily protein PhnB
MKLNPYLNFDGTCQDAMETYAKILGGEILAMMRFDEMPGDQRFPPEMAKKIAHARLKIGEAILMASDAQGPYAPMQGASTTLNSRAREGGGRLQRVAPRRKLIDATRGNVLGAQIWHAYRLLRHTLDGQLRETRRLVVALAPNGC